MALDTWIGCFGGSLALIGGLGIPLLCCPRRDGWSRDSSCTKPSKSWSGCGFDSCGLRETGVIHGQGARAVDTKDAVMFCRQYVMRQVDGIQTGSVTGSQLCISPGFLSVSWTCYGSC